jgi:hypothetical protein
MKNTEQKGCCLILSLDGLKEATEDVRIVGIATQIRLRQLTDTRRTITVCADLHGLEMLQAFG